MAKELELELKLLKRYRRAAFIVAFLKNFFRIKSERLDQLAYWLMKRGMRYRCGGKWKKLDWSKSDVA